MPLVLSIRDGILAAPQPGGQGVPLPEPSASAARRAER
jgi:hypothetical protein